MTKFALITGGTKGIGKAVAQILAKAGYNLILTYGNDVEAAQFVQAEFTEKFNTEIFILQADITSEKSIQVIFDFLKSLVRPRASTGGPWKKVLPVITEPTVSPLLIFFSVGCLFV